ncbi:MAG TPA: 2-pyrone-4,6-dicarboxylate hydrolase [Lachnoclostridium sp.]|nr:2-pyrone-4,6-dicarboxylate hydrolase [Lachnoclostridium sp.]
MKELSFQLPAHACNAHLHIIDPAFPNDGKADAQIGTIDMYRPIAEQLGLERAVFVNAKPFGTDNAVILDAVARFGKDRARGIAVCHGTVTDKELSEMNEGGIRGLRFSVWNPANAVVSFEDCFPLSERIKDMGWNVQLHMGASQLLEHADIIRKIRSKIVIDHMGRLDPKLGIKDPAWEFMKEMIDRGNTWVKISGPYLNTATGEPWEDASETAKAIAAYAPERVVWGSDYPHTTEKVKPDEGVLTEMIKDWFPTKEARELALVKNPEEVYGFGKE